MLRCSWSALWLVLCSAVSLRTATIQTAEPAVSFDALAVLWHTPRARVLTGALYYDMLHCALYASYEVYTFRQLANCLFCQPLHCVGGGVGGGACQRLPCTRHAQFYQHLFSTITGNACCALEFKFGKFHLQHIARHNVFIVHTSHTRPSQNCIVDYISFSTIPVFFLII